MSKFNFVSHESFPEDEYTKEIVYFDIMVPSRVAWVRKTAKTGGMFWDEASVGATKNGKKDYKKAWMQDSNFLQKDMKDFLDNRRWESPSASVSQTAPAYNPKPQSMDEVAEQDGLPF